jgi:hypothetical protein
MLLQQHSLHNSIHSIEDLDDAYLTTILYFMIVVGLAKD